jgi:23S rRNA (guanosine2251-2'-O)-methyltransferase
MEEEELEPETEDPVPAVVRPKPEPFRLIVGMQPVREAIRVHGALLTRVLVDERDNPLLAGVAKFASDRGATVTRVTRRELDRLAERHQGVIAYAPPLRVLRTVAEHAWSENAIVLALDEIEDPQNFGAIIRSAVAFGAEAVLFPEHHSAPLTPATFRASAGAVEHARLICASSLTSALDTLVSLGFVAIGLDANAKESLSSVTLTGKTVLVIGAEGKGLRKGVKTSLTTLAKLPMPGPIASLNASVAAALALYEARRQR